NILLMIKRSFIWKIPKLTPVIIFLICSAINDNLNYITYLNSRYKNKICNINNEKIKKVTKDIIKDLLK
ncbi:hypothetical protein, partial [Clostridium sp.]|uniref:hypothetical protein n=1 Tax=Clostridium sp. TaxID=1506 RepID=UPI0025C1F689